MASPLNFDGGLTIALSCRDLPASLDWYRNTLGFGLLYHKEDMGWAELSTETPGVNVGLSQVEDVKPGGPVPTFGVRDIASARAMLEQQGVRFDGETQTIPDMVSLATFFDPDGNALMLYESHENGS
ncbi:MAG: VOC family protein [Planctomycetota bacterium]